MTEFIPGPIDLAGQAFIKAFVEGAIPPDGMPVDWACTVDSNVGFSVTCIAWVTGYSSRTLWHHLKDMAHLGDMLYIEVCTEETEWRPVRYVTTTALPFLFERLHPAHLREPWRRARTLELRRLACEIFRRMEEPGAEIISDNNAKWLAEQGPEAVQEIMDLLRGRKRPKPTN